MLNKYSKWITVFVWWYWLWSAQAAQNELQQVLDGFIWSEKISVYFFSHVLEMVFLFSDREHTWAKSYCSKQNWYVHVILLWPSFLIVCDHLSLYKMNIMNISFWQYFFRIMLSKQSLSNKDSSTFFPLSCFVHLWW